MKKIIILTISVLILLFSVSIASATGGASDTDTTSVTASTNDTADKSNEGISGLVDKSWKIVGTVAWCGYAVALGMMIYIGIKYMLGSVDAKANMKSALSSYLIGAAFVFCASTIAMVVANLAAGGR